MKIGDKLRVLISSKFPSASAFAEKINVNYTQLSQYLNNHTKPSIAFLEKIIAEFPQADLNWLLKNEIDVSANNTLNDPKETYVSPINSKETIEEIESLLDNLKKQFPQ